ncbi:MAG: hypothetical protein K8R90_07885 [Candidatus Cloacimonetes bacterium]|nr:hypothetical protein [Candidatus Cloacimonadota bacterium]
MKRIAFFLILTGLLVSLMAQSQLEELYYRDYGEIVRLVLVFQSEPDCQIEQNGETSRLVIRLRNTTRSREVRNTYSLTSSRVLESIDVTEDGGALVLTIHTDKPYTLKRPTQGIDPKRIVLDIFGVAQPTTLAEHTSFAHYYSTVGYRNSALKEFEWLEANGDGDTDYHFDWGMMLLRQGKKQQAATHFRAVQPSANHYRKAQEEMAKLGGVPRPAPVAQPEPQATTQPVASETPEQPDEARGDDAQKFLQAQAAAAKAMVSGEQADFEQAATMLLEAGEDSVFKREAYVTLYSLYTSWGKPEKAKLYADEAELPKTSAMTWTPGENGGIMRLCIQFWLAILLAALVGLIVFFLMLIYYGYKKDKDEPEFTMADIREHSDNLVETYNESVEEEDELEKEEPEPESAPEAEEPEIEEPEIEEPEIELPVEAPEPEREELQEPEELPVDDTPGIGDPEYQKKMILKLSADGWDTEAIAKEMQISQREVEFILKTQS